MRFLGRGSSRPKQWNRQMSEQKKEESVSPLHSLRPINLQGVNSSISTYVAQASGTTNGHLWTLNLSGIPGEQKRLLTILGATTHLINYAQNSFPGKMNLLLNQAAPTLDQQGNPSNLISALVPHGSIVTTMNPGNIVGYNIVYSQICPNAAVDVTGIPQLTFDLATDNSTVPETYPLVNAITLIVQITHVLY